MNKLTEAERKLLDVLSRVVGNALPYEWMKPPMRAVATRMRRKGLLLKREKYWAKPTAKGRIAISGKSGSEKV